MKVYILLERCDPIVTGVFSSIENFETFVEMRYEELKLNELKYEPELRIVTKSFEEYLAEYRRDLEEHEIDGQLK